MGGNVYYGGGIGSSFCPIMGKLDEDLAHVWSYKMTSCDHGGGERFAIDILYAETMYGKIYGFATARDSSGLVK